MNNFMKWAESKQGMIVLGITAVLAVAIYIIRHGSGSVVAAPASNGGVTNMTPTGPMYTITTPPVSTPSSPGNPTPIQPIPIAPSPTGPPTPAAQGYFYTTKQGDTIASIYAAAQTIDPGHYWGQDRILLANPSLVGYGYNSVLPAGLTVQVGGPVP